MRKPFTRIRLAVILVLLSLSAQIFAKDNTIRITITGTGLQTPIEITDPSIVSQFDVWSGPGTDQNQTEGLNVAWHRGVAQVPKGLTVYTVSFLISRPDSRTYLVRYAFDLTTKQGYVYVPGKADADYRDNVRLIYRGIEGHWFYASSEWETVANTFIAHAQPVN